ncbi:hypothetical protein D9Q98_000613 [Chlorella vulgaris]|uniref:Uncharacterized protein n=1 Tax=Chlorella vulgaris TaxID=3077 RepID=A0A9D4Z2D7_CHLVU|nr:hypothetical protein D9Q98_000613 [Chlorella vulgaris]
MEDSESRRKRLKALAQSAADEGPQKAASSMAAGLVNPLADISKGPASSGPCSFYSDPVGAMERSRNAQAQRRDAVVTAAQQSAKDGRLQVPNPQWQQPGGVAPPRPRPPPGPWPGQPRPPPPHPGYHQQQQRPPYEQQGERRGPWQPRPPPGPPPPGLLPRPAGLLPTGGFQQQQQQQQQAAQLPQQFGGRGGGGGRQGGGRGGRGRGSGRGGGGGRGQGGDGFFNPSMLENPWAALERQKLHISPQIGVAAADSNDGESGRLDPNGVADRPWH